MKSLHALLENLIDYAGLYPPAGLPLAEVIRNYDRYLEIRGCLDSQPPGPSRLRS